MTSDKERLLNTLGAFVRQRPGLECANYGSVTTYRAEMRQITRDRHDAERLINAVAWRDSITANDIVVTSKYSFSGRLSIIEKDDGSFAIQYCTGQYFPTEYRKAVCSVLSHVMWGYYRKNALLSGHGEDGLGDYLRATLRREFGRAVANRYFR